jgi:hypothetical protein
MPRFLTVIRRARFVYSPFTGDEMASFGQILADAIRARIQSGRNVYDQPAAPLKPGRGGHPGYPDWTWSGHTLRCLKVLTANQNRAVLGFLDEAMPGRGQTASQIAFWNNQIEHMWGVSNADRAYVIPKPRARRRRCLPRRPTPAAWLSRAASFTNRPVSRTTPGTRSRRRCLRSAGSLAHSTRRRQRPTRRRAWGCRASP